MCRQELNLFYSNCRIERKDTDLTDVEVNQNVINVYWLIGLIAKSSFTVLVKNVHRLKCIQIHGKLGYVSQI
ncbi:hypothetical protein Q9306_03950 [Bacillus sp. WLY-B-L8]|nr:hypothetical protein [Bacillus sp. WLY-B-L8]